MKIFCGKVNLTVKPSRAIFMQNNAFFKDTALITPGYFGGNMKCIAFVPAHSVKSNTFATHLSTIY